MDKGKEEKKKKDKKPGMLSGLFRRKDKKAKAVEDDADETISNEKNSAESSRVSSRGSSRSSPVPDFTSEEQSRAEPLSQQTPARETSNKLQKKARSEGSPASESPVPQANASRERSPRAAYGPSRATPAEAAPDTDAGTSLRPGRSDSIRMLSRSPDGLSRSGLPPPVSEARQPKALSPEPEQETTEWEAVPDKQEQQQKNEEPATTATHAAESALVPEPAVAATADVPPTASQDRQPGWPVQDANAPRGTAIAVTTAAASHSPVPVLVEMTGAEEQSGSVVTPSTSSPETIDAPELQDEHRQPNGEEDASGNRATTPSSFGTSTATTNTQPPWNPAGLRAFLDSGEARDLVIIVNARSNIQVGPDHPCLGGLFQRQRRRLVELQEVSDSL